MADRETIDLYDTKAADYRRLVTNDKPDRHLAAFLDGLTEGARVLDLGCGPGNAAAAIAQARLDVLAVDASSAMVGLAHQHAGVTAQVAEFEDIPTLGAFEAVWANFSLLHAERTAMPKHLAAIADALPQGGRLHIGLKTGTGAQRDNLGRFYTYYEEAEIRDLLVEAGFQVTAIWFGAEEGFDGIVAPWIILHADKD